MKTAFLAGLLAAGVAAQEGDGEATDGARLLNDLASANADKDSLVLNSVLKKVIEWAQANPDHELAEAFADELGTSQKVARGNWGTLRTIATALGQLRAKKGLRPLKRMAFVRKAKNTDEEELQAAALEALGMYGDPKLLKDIADECKNRSVTVAKGAYSAFQHYASQPGKVRRAAAEILMKRLDAEKPSSGAGKGVSAEAQERWNQLKDVVVVAMQKICRETTINDVENWREWWKENKQRRSSVWDDPEPEDKG